MRNSIHYRSKADRIRFLFIQKNKKNKYMDTIDTMVTSAIT